MYTALAYLRPGKVPLRRVHVHFVTYTKLMEANIMRNGSCVEAFSMVRVNKVNYESIMLQYSGQWYVTVVENITSIT